MAVVDKDRLVFPALAGVYEKLAPFGPTLARVSLGLILVPHGYAKLFQDDAVNASRNFVNFGWAYPLAWAYFIAIEMAVISFAVLYPSWSWGRRGMEYALFMGLIAISVLLRGGGRYSLDRLLRKEF